MLTVKHEPWMRQAPCNHAPLRYFFPNIEHPDGEEVMDDGTVFKSYGDTTSYYLAGKRICATCPVSGECLTYANENRIRYGLFGGKDPLERRRAERTIRRAKKRERDKMIAMGIPVDDWEEDEDDTD